MEMKRKNVTRYMETSGFPNAHLDLQPADQRRRMYSNVNCTIMIFSRMFSTYSEVEEIRSSLSSYTSPVMNIVRMRHAKTRRNLNLLLTKT